MMSDNPPARHWEGEEVTDLERVLDQRGIEHLDVNRSRTFVLYRKAILNLVVTDGKLAAARAATVECWEASQRSTDPGPEEVLTIFCEKVRATPDR